MFSNHNGIKLEINSRRKLENSQIHDIQQHTLKQHQKEITKEIRKYLEANENTTTQNWDAVKTVLKREIYSYKCLDYKRKKVLKSAT